MLIAGVAEISPEDDVTRLDGSDLLTNGFGFRRVFLYQYLLLLSELFLCPEYS